MLSCKKATELTLKKQEGNLSTLNSFRLWLHHTLCGLCKSFETQNSLLDNSLSKELKANNNNSPQKQLSEEDKKQMLKNILGE